MELVGLACGLGHAPALTVHRTVIHYRRAALLRADSKSNIFAGVMELAGSRLRARSRVGSDSPPDCHSLPPRRYAACGLKIQYYLPV